MWQLERTRREGLVEQHQTVKYMCDESTQRRGQGMGQKEYLRKWCPKFPKFGIKHVFMDSMVTVGHKQFKPREKPKKHPVPHSQAEEKQNKEKSLQHSENNGTCTHEINSSNF